MAAVGVSTNYDPKKTEVLLSLKGRNSKAVRRALLVHDEAKISLTTSDGKVQELRLTHRYAHLGTVVQGKGGQYAEVKQRGALARATYLRLRRSVFRNSALQRRQRVHLFCQLILKSLLHHAWTV